MPSNKVNRLNELNKLWFRLNTPKEGDKVKFLVKDTGEIHEGEITQVVKDAYNRYKFQMVSKTASPGDTNIEILEINGVKFQGTDAYNDFKPI